MLVESSDGGELEHSVSKEILRRVVGGGGGGGGGWGACCRAFFMSFFPRSACGESFRLWLRPQVAETEW